MVRFIGIGIETTYGEAATITDYIDAVSESITGGQSFIDVETAGTRWIRERVPGPWSESGSFDIIVNADNITKILKCALGDVTTSDDGGSPAVAYKHEFKPSSTLPSFTLEVCPDVGSYSRQIVGCGITSLRFEAPARELLTASVDILAAKEKLISPSTPTFTTRRPFVFYDGQISGLVTANVEAFRLTIENDIPDDAFVLGSRFLPGLRVQGFTVSGELDLTFLDWDAYQKFLGSASATEPGTTAESYSLTATFTSPEETGSSVAGFENYELEFHLPKIYLDTAEAHFDRRDRIVETVRFTAVYDSTADYVVKVTVVNTKSEP